MLRFIQFVLAGVFAAACAALVALWIRSYWWADVVFWPNPIASLQIVSMEGRLKIVRSELNFPGINSLVVNSYNASGREADVISGNLRNGTNPHGFGLLRTRPSAICFPYWFPILITGTFAAVLGIKRMRRFNLRFMLFLTTMVAILLAVIVRR